MPDFKTIADFRKDNGPAIRKLCARLVELCPRLGLSAVASVAIDGSEFKASTIVQPPLIGPLNRRFCKLTLDLADAC